MPQKLLIKALISVAGVAILWVAFAMMGAKIHALTDENDYLRDKANRLSLENNKLSSNITKLGLQAQELNSLVAKESERKVRAQAKSAELRRQARYALKTNKCSYEPIPDSVTDELRKEADRIRTQP